MCPHPRNSRYFGSHTTCYQGPGCDPDEIRIIKKVTVHPDHDNGVLLNDIAIVELDAPVTTIQPAVLETGDFLAGGEAMVLGWGVVDTATGEIASVLQEAAVSMVKRSDCRKLPFLYTQEKLFPGMMCAHAPGRDACQGDSGSR
jgi:trypsin